MNRAGAASVGLREPVNALTHWLGVVGALTLLWPLLAWADRHGLARWPFVVFDLSMLVLYAASASYHSFDVGRWPWLRRLDHAGIFLLIAGTYTPVAFFGLSGVWRGAVLWGIWGLAAAGMVMKLWSMALPRWVSTALYVGMGWLAILFLPQLSRHLPGPAITWLALGGVLYTLGAVVYGTKRWNLRPGFGFHEVWHLFVLAGSAAHTVMMFCLR